MLKLTAIATSQKDHGECFLWQRNDDRTVCVDAGKTHGMGRMAAEYHPEILILSHDDHDHIGGAVELIQQCGGSLNELWVPADWLVAVLHLAEIVAQGGAGESAEIVSIDELGSRITDVFDEVEDGRGTAEVNCLQTALNYLSTSGWFMSQRERIKPASYGMSIPQDVLGRAIKSRKRIVDILKHACKFSVRIRFFSFDLAQKHPSRRAWVRSGSPGRVTIANALEVKAVCKAQLPVNLNTFALLYQLSVQNRRSLTTLLWSRKSCFEHAAIIWSDTDGAWLKAVLSQGFSKVSRTLIASSAPHHASSQLAHLPVWNEIGRSKNNPVVICAGGQHNQTYATQYLNKALRCCTICRKCRVPPNDVVASSSNFYGMTLDRSCFSIHR